MFLKICVLWALFFPSHSAGTPRCPSWGAAEKTQHISLAHRSAPGPQFPHLPVVDEEGERVPYKRGDS